MSSNNIVFEETLDIKEIDKDLKVFDKVQRCEGVYRKVLNSISKTQDSKYKISMDINSEIYPMKKDASYKLLLAKSIYESKPTPKHFDYELFTNTKNTLMDNYDYVMCGKVFEFSPDKKDDNDPSDTLSISISFGGLLFRISGIKRDVKTGKPNGFEDINLDDTLYLLIKKISK